MSTKYSSEIDATPEYVLSVLQDEHRQIVQVDDACDPDIDLTFDSTVADWRDAMDYLPAKQLGRGLNVSWALSLPDAAWRNILTPEREKTLRDVTNLIARHTTRTQLQPLQIAGTSCLPGAAFLAIKDCLAADNVDVSAIAPSTSLDEYTCHHWQTFILRISRLSPGALPLTSVQSYAHDANHAIGCLAVFTLALGLFAGRFTSIVLAIGFTLQLLALMHGNCIRNCPLDVAKFGELRTFRDLSLCIAKSAGKQSEATEL